MKKHKKNILIIAVIFFVLLGLSGGVRTFATNEDGDSWQWSSHDREDDTDDNEDHTEIDPAGGGGTTGGTTDPGAGNGDDQGQRIKRSASSSITIKVVNKGPVCSTETYYKCEIGEVVESSKKHETEQGKDLYTWECKGAKGVTPVSCLFEGPRIGQLVCGDFSFNEGYWEDGCKYGLPKYKQYNSSTGRYEFECSTKQESDWKYPYPEKTPDVCDSGTATKKTVTDGEKDSHCALMCTQTLSITDWVGQCNGGNLVEGSKKYNSKTNTFSWSCKNPETEITCNYTPQDGKCNYNENYYPVYTSGGVDYSKISLCEKGDATNKSVKGHTKQTCNSPAEYRDDALFWDCEGEEGGKVAMCQKSIYPGVLCGSYGEKNHLGVDQTCYYGDLIKGSEKYDEEGGLISWRCVNERNSVDTITCTPDGESESEGEKNVVDSVDGICGNNLYGCEKGKLLKLSEKIDGYYWECLGQDGGEDTSCFQEKPKKDGQCGSAHGAFYSITPKDKDLCSSGQIIGPIKIGDRAWSWQCAGSNGGKTASCQTFSVSLSPKISGCYIKEGESVCQPEKEYSWIASGIDSILSLITNMSVFELDSNSGSRSLSVRYPMSDIFLKKGEEELAHSRAWAVCENGLYWDKENNKCVAPIECPKPPEEDKEGKTDKTIPYWKKGGAPVCQKDSNGTYFAVYEETCEGYDEGKNLFCRDENGAENKGEIRETELPCYQNRKQTATISVTLKAERDGSNLEITESNGTEYPFYLKWKAFATKENGEPELVTCKDIKLTEGGGVLYDKTISTGGRSSGTSKVKNPGIKKDTLKYEITCSSYSGAKGTGTVKVYLEKRDGEISET